jgi:hypothetical protein
MHAGTARAPDLKVELENDTHYTSSLVIDLSIVIGHLAGIKSITDFMPTSLMNIQEPSVY